MVSLADVSRYWIGALLVSGIIFKNQIVAILKSSF
jgi:hypothetical protein